MTALEPLGGPLPGTTPADEPGRQDFPGWPVTAAQVTCFLQKVIA